MTDGSDPVPGGLSPAVAEGTREALEILIKNYKGLEEWARCERQRLQDELRKLRAAEAVRAEELGARARLNEVTPK